MIRGFRDKDTERLFYREPVKKWGPDVQRTGLRKLRINEEDMPRKRLSPIHPGEVLLHDFLEPLELTQYRLAKNLRVPARRINEIVHGTRAVSADTALRLARFFGTSDLLWLNLQAAYDLDVERDRVGARIAREVPVFRKAG